MAKKNKNRKSRMILRTRQRTRLTLQTKIAVAASLVTVMTVALILFFNLSGSRKAMASTSGDYRSAASGNWNSAATWQIFNGTSWVSAVSTPTSSDGAITIQNGHTVTVTASVTVDQVTINSGGQVVLSTGTFSVVAGTGDDLTVNGTMTLNSTLAMKTSSTQKINGLVVMSTGGDLTFQSGSTLTINNGGRYRRDAGSQTNGAAYWIVGSGGTYQDNQDNSALPNATWNTNSTCEITGVTSNLPSNMSQSFYNFTWNCTTQTSHSNIGGTNLNTINGDLKIISTGTGALLMNQSANSTYTIGGNIYIQGGSLYITQSGGPDINLAGDYIQSGGNFYMTDATSSSGSGTPTLTVNGNFSLSSGTFSMSQYTNNSVNAGIGTLNLNGNFTFSGGTITETASNTGHGEIYFTKSGTQTVTGGGTITNTINFTVQNSSTVDFGTSVITGGGSFTSSSGAGIVISSASGITGSGSSGSIQVTGTRSYGTGSDYTFNGSSAQNTGSGLPSTVHNLAINNSNGVTLTNTVSVSNTLTFTSGKITTNANELKVTNTSASAITGYSSSNYVIGNLRRSVSGTGSYDYPLGTSANYELVNLNLSGATGFTDILGTFTNANPIAVSFPLSGVLVNGTTIDDMLDYGYWIMTPNIPMTGGTYSITLNEQGQSNAGVTAANHCVLKRSNALASWQSLGTHTNSTQTITGGVVTAARSALTSFSHFGIGKKSGGGALPIELIYFKAELAEDAVNFSWATASELNNDYFTVERSPDGINFNEVLKKQGAGNSTVTLYYSGTDENPLSGYSYYRLRQTDYDGHFTYSEIQTVKDKSKGDDQLLKITSVAPVPFREKFSVSFVLKTATTVDFQLFNASGEMVFNDKINSNDGMNQYDFIDEKGLRPGIYFMTLLYNNQKLVQKVMKN